MLHTQPSTTPINHSVLLCRKWRGDTAGGERHQHERAGEEEEVHLVSLGSETCQIIKDSASRVGALLPCASSTSCSATRRHPAIWSTKLRATFWQPRCPELCRRPRPSKRRQTQHHKKGPRGPSPMVPISSNRKAPSMYNSMASQHAALQFGC